MERKAFFPGLPKIATAFRTHPLWASTTGLGFLGVVWDRIDDYLTGTGLMAAWLGPDWFSIAVQSPWFTLAGLALMLASLRRIGALAVQAERDSAEKETQVRQKTAEIPILQARIASFDRDLLELDRDIEHFERLATRRKDLLNKSRTAQSWLSTDRSVFDQPFISQHTQKNYINFTTNLADINIEPVIPVTDHEAAHMGRMAHSYDPEQNRVFINYQERVYNAHESWVEQLKSDRIKFINQRNLLERTLDEKLKHYA